MSVAYQSLLSKTAPTQSIAVYDLARDKAGPLGRQGVDTIIALQGLLNRDAADKVYLTDVPIRLFWSTKDAFGEDPARSMLADGLIPGDSSEPALDPESDQPVLAALLALAGNRVRGLALHDAAQDRSGAVCAALTAAAFDDLLPVGPLVADWLRQAGIELPVLADLRGMDNLAALRWTITHYADDPRRNQTSLGFHWAIQEATMADYWIATRTICFYLERDDPAQELAFAELLDGKRFAPGTPVIGAIEGTRARLRLCDLGYRAICGHLPNGSVTSSQPSDPASFPPLRPVEPAAVDDNAVYLAWIPAGNGADADALDFAAYLTYPALRGDQPASRLPFGLRSSPWLIDLFPALHAWFANCAEGVELVSCADDGWMPKTEAGREAWAEATQRQLAAGPFAVVNVFDFYFFEHHRDVAGEALDRSGPELVVRGYDGSHYAAEFSRCQLSLRDGATYATQLCRCDDEVSAAVQRIRRAATAPNPDGGPRFIVAKFGHGKPYPVSSWLRAAMAEIAADPSLADRVQLVSPRGLAATYRAWLDSGGRSYPHPRTMPV